MTLNRRDFLKLSAITLPTTYIPFTMAENGSFRLQNNAVTYPTLNPSYPYGGNTVGQDGASMSMCDFIGISGGCGSECSVFKNSNCMEPFETIHQEFLLGNLEVFEYYPQFEEYYINKYTDFKKCEWTYNSDPDYSICEKCNTKTFQIYFGNKDYWSEDGDYWCPTCILALISENLDANYHS